MSVFSAASLAIGAALVTWLDYGAIFATIGAVTAAAAAYGGVRLRGEILRPVVEEVVQRPSRDPVG